MTLDQRLQDVIDSVVPSGVTHLGFIATNVYGDFLVTEPTGHPDGVSATFNKIRVKSGERPSETLSRCILEQISLDPRGFFPIPVVWTTAKSAGFYFAGMIWNEGQPIKNQAAHASWLRRDVAKRKISESKNAESRRRDLGLLAAACDMCLSPYRRILLMVRELHRMGFERLRAAAYEYPLAWRCPVVPSYWTLKSHGGACDFPLYTVAQMFGHDFAHYWYTAGSGQFAFEWQDVAFASPKELADRFLRERREIAVAGWGPDAPYVCWFEEVLELTRPNGIFAAYGNHLPPEKATYAIHANVARLPPPPPGLAERGEFDHHRRTADDEVPDGFSPSTSPPEQRKPGASLYDWK